MAPTLNARLQGIKLMAFDVDGILTNGQLLYTDGGTEIKAFDTRDGLGIKLLREAGIKLAIITARRSELVERRARDLGVHYCYQGSEAKLSAFREILTDLKLDGAQAGYMGDDLVDLPVLIRAGFAATVPEAVDAVRERCHYVTLRSGGRGAVREVCEMILRAQGHLDRALTEYLK
jgi:3-deoxy-D-manno-octulosonate 8-phosphate phosphatase (KDO 8-P phosphatase)